MNNTSRTFITFNTTWKWRDMLFTRELFALPDNLHASIDVEC